MKKILWTAVAMLTLGSQGVMAATNLKFSHSYTQSDARHEWAAHVAGLINEKTNGEVTVSIHPNQQISKAMAQHQGLQQRRIDMAIYPLPWLSGMAPLTEIGALPGLVTEPKDGLVWRERRIWPMLEQAVASTGVVLAGSGWAMATIGNTGKPILLPSDLAQNKMRGLGKSSESMLMENGATITSLPASEIYQGLQTGVLTGVLTQYASFEGYNLNEVIDHLMVGKGFIGGMHTILLSPGVQKKVGDQHYQAILEAVQESEAWFADKMAADSQRIAQEFGERGVTLHSLSDEQLQAWLDNAKKTAWPWFVKNVPEGADALKAIDEPL
ncbi:TRAP transporter substrate-binding protein [Stutzerimonas azotifigens]|uniref:TRAP transporter substrate-binding protein n=1 Tax=Stutzerimonas azotifigens TaxID=291995 RepID=UPI000404B74F|nr:TRAP transporter substrate-binding protein DctP [Stutzerimonas azotifigens]